MPFNFNTDVVVWTFKEAHPDDLSPTADKHDAWNRELVQDYDGELNAQLPENNIPVSIDNKSLILALAQISGSSNIRNKVTAACRYFAKIWPAGTPAPSAFAAFAVGVSKPAAKKAKPKKKKGA